MAILIQPPPRIPRPRATALTSYFPLDVMPVGAQDNHRDRWAFDGVTFVGYGCDTAIEAQSVDPCADDGDTYVDEQQGFPAETTFPVFAFKVSIACSLLSLTGDDLQKQLDVLVENELSPIFGEQVMSATWNPAAPSLVSEAVDVSQTGMENPLEAVAAVEDGLADVWRGSVGMIHMPPSVLLQIVDTLEFVEGRFITPSGHIVVADAGYQAGSPASGVVTSGEAWVYGSSPVHYRYLTPDFSGEYWQNWIRDHNDQVVRVDGVGVAVFEPCSVVTAQVNYTP